MMTFLLLEISFLQEIIGEKLCKNIQKSSVSMLYLETWVPWHELVIKVKLNRHLFELLLCSSSQLDICLLWVLESGGVKGK